MLQFGVQLAQVVVGVVEAGEVDDALAVQVHQHVVGNLQRRAAVTLRDGGDALRLRRFVVGLGAQRIHLVEALGQVGGAGVVLGGTHQRRHVGELRAHRGVAQTGQLLGPWQRRDLLPQRVRHEGMGRAEPCHQNAGGPTGHRAVQGHVLLVRLVERGQQALPGVGRLVGLHQRKGHRQVVVARQLRHPGQLGFHLVVVRRHLEHAVAHLAEHTGDAEDLVRRRERARRVFAALVLVDDRPACRQAQCPGAHALAHQLHHRLDVRWRGLVVRDAALAHHEGAQRRVGNLGADVEGARHALERVEVLGKGLPLPVDAFGQHGAGDVFHALHDADEPVALVGMHRRETDPAIAHDDAGHTVVGGRAEVRVPGHLAVVVRVHVDPAGRHDRAAGVDLAPGGTELAADLGDAAVGDAEVAGEARLAAAVDERAAANDGVEHVGSLGVVSEVSPA